MQLTTPVELPKNLPDINHRQKLLLMGSCFAENIGKQLYNRGFKIDINPFGIVYNPMSVAYALQQIISGTRYTEQNLFYYNECWHSPMHHGSFSSADASTTLEAINQRLKQAEQLLKNEADWLVITFGTAYAYTDKSSLSIVSNCHKQPEKLFTRRLLTVGEIVDTYQQLLSDLFTTNPKLKVLFTVSPIRHIRDGLHANQLSKSTLLLAIEELQRLFPNAIFYFPSYEILIDELRDYRFYANDFTHPSELSIEYIWRQFTTVFFSTETKKIIDECEKITKALSHRPLFPDSEKHKSFLAKIELKIEQLNRKYPYLEFQFETSTT